MIPVWLRYGERLGRLLRRVRFSLRPALLIIKPGSLGDAFLFTGALKALRQQYPRYRLVMASSARAFPVLARCPDVDVLLALDESEGGEKGVAARWQRLFFAVSVFCRKYELVIMPCFDDGSGWGALIFERVQAERKHCLSDTALRGVHEMDKTLAVLQAAGCAVASRKDIWPEGGISAREREWAGEALGKVESRKSKVERQAEDGRRKTEDLGEGEALGTAQTRDCRLQTADFLGGEASGSDDAEQGLRSAVCGLQSEPKSLRSAVCGLQSGQLTLALCPGARFKQKQWGAEKYSQLLVEMAMGKVALGTAQTADCRLQTADLLRGEASGSDDAEQGLRSAVCGLQSAVCLRVLILGGVEDRTIAGEILERLQTEDLRRKTEDCRLKTTDRRGQTSRFHHKEHKDREMEDGLGKSEIRNQKLEMGGESLAESQRSPRNYNEERRTKNQELIIEDYTGRCTLHESFALIEQSDLCVGNDTLGLHVAIAVGTPSVVVMWGGDGDQWIPWGDTEKHRMVRADVDCGGCGGKCVHETHECMEWISVEMVMAEIRKVESRSSFARALRRTWAQRLA